MCVPRPVWVGCGSGLKESQGTWSPVREGKSEQAKRLMKRARASPQYLVDHMEGYNLH